MCFKVRKVISSLLFLSPINHKKMGKKPQKKNNQQLSKDQSKKLSPQKRHELNQLIDVLLNLGFKQAQTITDQWSQYNEIQGILDRIQAIENVLKVKNTKQKSRGANIGAFCKWAEDNGAIFDSIKVAEISGYDLGLEATKEINKGDNFVIIPKKMIMSEEDLSSTLIPIASEIPMLDSMNNVKLAFALLLEKLNPDSFWKPYIDILPEKYSTVMYFTVNEMQELKGSNVLGQALNQCKFIARQYAFIYKCVQNVRSDVYGKNSDGGKAFDLLKEKFTYELYRWAVSTVMTRQNSIPRSKKNEQENKDNNELMPALIPLWDMANHQDGEFTSSFDMELNRLESCALSNYMKGEQIFIHYGDRPNAHFLVHNGFVYANNTKDNVCIRLGLSASDELFTERSQLLEQLNIPKNCELKVLQSPDYISPELLAFVRIFNMNQDQIKHWLNSERAADLLHIDCALETSLESKTWIFLQTRLTLLLKVFPTTLEDDEIMLANHLKGQTKMGHNKAMLIQYRILEKKILSNALEYAKQRTKP